jgi:hypothetical protein
MLATHLLQDLVAAYDASIHFVYENLAAKLPRFAHLLCRRGVGADPVDAQQLRCGLLYQTIQLLVELFDLLL